MQYRIIYNRVVKILVIWFCVVSVSLPVMTGSCCRHSYSGQFTTNHELLDTRTVV